MPTLTIPREIMMGKKELVIVPRKEYEEFRHWRGIRNVAEPPKQFKTFKPTLAELKTLKRAREEHKRGEYVVIKNRADLERELGVTFKGTR